MKHPFAIHPSGASSLLHSHIQRLIEQSEVVGVDLLVPVAGQTVDAGEAFIADMIDRGDLKYQEDVEIGDLDVIPGQFCKLFHGSNHGKALVKIDAKAGAEIKAKRAADRAERVRQREAEDEEARRLEAAEKAEAMAEAKAAS